MPSYIPGQLLGFSLSLLAVEGRCHFYCHPFPMWISIPSNLHVPHQALIGSMATAACNDWLDGSGSNLWGDYIFQTRLCLDCGEAGRIPAAAEGLNQQDAGDQTLPLDYGHLLLIGQEILLGADDVKITDKAAHIAIGGNFQRLLGGLHRLRLGLARGIEHR